MRNAMWTCPPRRIVTAVDFGEASAQAVGVAAALASASGAALTLLHAETLEAPPYFTAEQIDAIEHQRQAARAEAQRYLTRFGRRHTAVPFEAAIADGPPADAILRAAAGADLVVMGTHGRRGPGRWWLGSVAERVLRHTGVPLLVTREGTVDTARGVFARVLLSVSPDSASVRQPAEAYARALAAQFGGTLAVALSAEDVHDAARRGDATLIVVALAAGERRHGLDATERLLRSCSHPTLFLLERHADDEGAQATGA
ncbi:MAG: universal stress protein [Acidobacteriota bacterium]|nr:universal stress protein [Acidobacteriota bacterium]